MKRFQITFIPCGPLELIARILRREIRFRGNAALKCYLESFCAERALVLTTIYKVPGVQIAELVVLAGRRVPVQKTVHLICEHVPDIGCLRTGAADLIDKRREIFQFRVVNPVWHGLLRLQSHCGGPEKQGHHCHDEFLTNRCYCHDNLLIVFLISALSC